MSTTPFLHEAREIVTFTAGQKIFTEGQPGDKMYVVREGEVHLSVRGKWIASVDRGGILGEMSLIDNQPRSASATAATDCTLVAIDEDTFIALVKANPLFALQVMRTLVQRLREMDTWI